MANRKRVFQIAERVRSCVANKLLDVSDPRLSLVTITSVMVTADLRIAKVYWVASGDPSRVKEIGEAFAHAEGLFKREIARELHTKFVPELKFFYDDTFTTKNDIESLMERVKDAELRAERERIEKLEKLEGSSQDSDSEHNSERDAVLETTK
jgi:ribosome-binding factor A